MSDAHIQDELVASPARVTVQTRYGPVTGGKAKNGAIVFLGVSILLYRRAHALNSAQRYPMLYLQGDLKILGRCRSVIAMKRRNISSRALVGHVRTVGKMRTEYPSSDGVQPLNDGQAASEDAENPDY